MPRKRKLPEGMYQRGRHYYADFYAGGQRIRKKLATDLDAAKDILIELPARARKAGVATQTLDSEGQPLEHVDVHSRRRTFATDLIVNGTDPKTVQELLGHKTLAMTMKLYAKVGPQNKRQAVGRLSYGGVVAPGHILEYPAPGANSVQAGHQSVTAAGEVS
jgi:integrase